MRIGLAEISAGPRGEEKLNSDVAPEALGPATLRGPSLRPPVCLSLAFESTGGRDEASPGVPRGSHPHVAVTFLGGLGPSQARLGWVGVLHHSRFQNRHATRPPWRQPQRP